ncbi:hypothetical protein PQX77_011437 [Marasmius sp. AFHP31]|nr:hypothetical protein PQX77_011437 [Marasmius sp. AFHP31]
MFPPEITIHILSFLDAKLDKRILQNCALVDSVWLSAAQPIIFNHLSLSLTPPHHEDYESLSFQLIESHKRLLEALDTHPHLASYIRSVRLKNFEVHISRRANVRWAEESASVARVVSRLSNVRSLTLFRMGPQTLDLSLQEAIYRLFRLSSITSLEISHSNFASFSHFMEMVSSPPNLARISLTSLLFPRIGDPAPARTPPHPVYSLDLGVVRMEPFASYFASSQCAFDFSGLENLRLNQPRDGGAQSVLALVGRGLKHLELADIPTSEKDSNLKLNDNVPILRSLLLGVRHTSTHSPVSWIQSLFAASESHSSSIESITLRMELDVPEDEGTFATFLAPWRAVDALFSDSLTFPLLHSVSIELYKGSAISLNLIRHQFPTLAGDGRIKVTKEWEMRPSPTTWR